MANLTKILPTANFEQFMADHGFLTKPQLARLNKIKQSELGSGAKNATTEDITHLILTQRLLDEEDVAKAKAAFLNLPYIDLRKISVLPEVLNTVPEESRNFYQMTPFEMRGRDLKVALLNPSNLQALEALEFLGQKTGNQIHIYVASQSSIDTVRSGAKSIKTVVGEALQDIRQKEEQDKEIKLSIQRQPEAGQQVTEEAPIIKIVDVILSNAIEADASDIHIEPSENDVRVRYRIDGILHTSLRLPKPVLSAIVSRIKILSNLKIDEHRLPQDGRFHIEFGKKSVDMRVSTLPLMYGEKVVMRILDKTAAVPTLEELGLRGLGLKWVKENILKTHGIFLITGPTGSGKSTTLYSILSLRNTTEVNIVTLEDPVEYFIEGVNQSQINPEIGLTFASGLRSILRQDPNIVMVGEIRDEETAELAVHAALTGHLVFSTLHTNNAVGAIPRMVNMGIEAFLLSASMNLVMAQRLVRKLCEHCKQPLELTAMARKEVEVALQGVPPEYLKGVDLKKLPAFQPKGCEECGGVGYKGRIGIFEVMPLTADMQDLVFAKTPAHKIYEAALKMGMITMKQDGIVKVLHGETTLDEILRVTTE